MEKTLFGQVVIKYIIYFLAELARLTLSRKVNILNQNRNATSLTMPANYCKKIIILKGIVKAHLGNINFSEPVYLTLMIAIE